jgi:dynamin-binding protein
MTKEDTKLIFNNISELAVIADSFTGSLEEALGSALEGGHGKDRVGALFLEMVSTLPP